MNISRILVINPGSTSTKVAVYDNTKSVFLKNIKHSNQDLEKFDTIVSQYHFRKDVIISELKKADICLDNLKAVIGRGGLLKPIKSGVYEVNEQMKKDLTEGIMGQHASNLGGLLADEIANDINGAKAFIADPVVVDELEDVARITGLPSMPNKSIFHPLNQKAVARQFARTRGFIYEDLNLIVAHLGGGISIGTHKKGRIIDVNNALNGDGPLSPERSGSLPTKSLVDACFSGKYTHQEMLKMISGKGGLVAHLGTNQCYEAEKMAQNGDKHAKLIIEAMAYQIGKHIGAAAAILKGKVNGIIITGGIAHSEMIVNYIKEMVDFIAPIAIYPGEDEMGALMQNALRALQNPEVCKKYK